MPNPFDEVLEVQPEVKPESTGNPFDEVVGNPFDEVLKPDLSSLPEYLRYKVALDTADSVKGNWGAKAMAGYISKEQMLTEGKAEYQKYYDQAGPYKEVGFKEAPIKYVAGEAAQLVPYMLSSMREGLFQGSLMGGGFAGITALAGQAGPQVGLPEEIVTVPSAFAVGMTTGFGYGVVKNTLDREGGSMYFDLVEQGIDEKTARTVAMSSGTLVGLIELAQVGVLAKPFKKAFSKVVRTEIGKGAMAGVVKRYLANLGEQVSQEEIQQIVS